MDTKKPKINKAITFILIELGIVAIISLIWWLSGNHTVLNYSNFLFLGGFAVMLVGLLTMVGTIRSTGNYNYQFAKTVSPDRDNVHVVRDWKERFANQGRILIFILYGLPIILLGVLVNVIWG
jgi:hypothetical protein